MKITIRFFQVSTVILCVGLIAPQSASAWQKPDKTKKAPLARSAAPAVLGQPNGRSLSSISPDYLVASLALTAEQREKLNTIHSDIRSSTKTVYQSALGDAAKMKLAGDRVTEIRKNADTEIDALFSPDQRSKVMAAVNNLQICNKAGIPEPAVVAINLTSDQLRKLEVIGNDSRATLMPKLKAIVESNDRTKMRDLMKESMDETRKKTTLILTLAQNKIMARYLAARAQLTAPTAAIKK